MVVVDLNTLSTFAQVGEVELLRKLFHGETLFLTPACLNEARRAVEAGCDFLRPALEAVESGAGLDLVPLTKEELLLLSSLPASLGVGERESLAVCSRRSGAKLLTNDKRARNFCRESAISKSSKILSTAETAKPAEIWLFLCVLCDLCGEKTRTGFVTTYLPCLDLPELLRALWQRGLCSKPEVRDLMTEMERREGIVFKDKESIFR